jgi:hypothetical protein
MPTDKPSKAAERKERLAAQLRENLRKRKAQARVKRDADRPDSPAGEAPARLAPTKSVG